jgi:hypothetical protein
MNSSRIAFAAAIAAAVSWTLKSIAIGTAGGLGKSPFEGPFYFAGLAFFLIGSVALGVAITRRRPLWVRIIAGGVVVPVLGIGLAVVVDALVSSVYPVSPLRHWAWTEVNLWVIAAAVLALSLVVRARQESRSPSAH